MLFGLKPLYFVLYSPQPSGWGKLNLAGNLFYYPALQVKSVKLLNEVFDPEYLVFSIPLGLVFFFMNSLYGTRAFRLQPSGVINVNYILL